MKKVLAMQKLTSNTRSSSGGSGGYSNLSLLGSCADSGVSLLGCH